MKITLCFPSWQTGVEKKWSFSRNYLFGQLAAVSGCSFLLWRKTATLQRGVSWDFGGISLLMLQFFPNPYLRMQFYRLPQESPWLHAFYCNDNMNFCVLEFLNSDIFKTFCVVRCTNELIELWWKNGDFRLLYCVFFTSSVWRYVDNLRIGGITNNLKKEHIFLRCGRNLRVGKII